MRTRTIELFKKFISIDYPITSEMLSDEFQISVRTIRNEIQEINAFLTQRQFPLISTVRSKGFIINAPQDEKQLIYNALLGIPISSILSKDERQFDLLLSIAFSASPTILSHKEDVYFVSKSVLDEDVRKLKARLKKYDIELISQPKQGMQFVGLERSIRLMMYEAINQFLGNLELDKPRNEMSLIQQLLFNYIPQELIDSLLQLAHQTLSQIHDEIYVQQLVVFTAIWIIRNQQQHHLTMIRVDFNNNDLGEIARFIHLTCQQIALQVSRQEQQYIIYMLEAFNTKDINNYVEWVNAQLLAIKLVNYVEEKTQIPFSTKQEQLYENLCKHLAGLIARVSNNIHIVNPLLDNIKQNYSEIHAVITTFMHDLETTLSRKISDDEIAFLTIHFSAFASAINQQRSYYFKAVVFCDHGIATSNLLAETLKEFFSIDVLAILGRHDQDLLAQLDFDLIFSTFPLQHLAHPVLVLEPILKEKNHPIITDFLAKHSANQRVVNHLVDATDLFYSLVDLIQQSGGIVSAPIYNQLEKCLAINNLKINKRKIQPMLKDILTDNDIILQQDSSDWRQAIKIAAEPLLKKQFILPSYIEAMITSVEQYGPYIVIGKHLALAHARPEDGVNQLGVSVVTMRHAVDFGNSEMGPVKIIFCLAAIDSFSHLNIMRSLIELINDEQKLERLTMCDSVQQFKTILFNEPNLD
ncbi:MULTISPECIES: PTS sugar transporter subunit IIA [unclassified Gilliamella]|uniref:BglG family transcription antiterminator n=1 Tax=unclassified Gilliamella TaxID=2685620 RepID=UPI00130A0DA3|nr:MULTISPECIES: PTS sugar transporter subunit IIA [unclassified Gilliamella]MWP48229.1 PRD domain-containing protein [Gilliamella sp. Lep-s35]MWP68149.1 PRD domain-containing protein [Gilliamella sp. Lep-s5]MWP76369.1 PRD domain-containing protein [Gilliamella sp. Lep-s21]